MKQSCIRLLVVVAVCLGLTTGAVAVLSEIQAGGCRCPLLWAPVICDNGKTYSNQCFADCAHAKNCVPTGGAVQ